MSWFDILKARASNSELALLEKCEKASVQSFDKDMWMGFAGATPWKDGEPIFREFADGRLVIASDGGIECYIVTEDSEEPVWYTLGHGVGQWFNNTVLTRSAAVMFLGALPEGFDLEKFGFQKV